MNIAWNQWPREPCYVCAAHDYCGVQVVVALLWAGWSRHADDHQPFADAAQLLKDMAVCPPACDGPRRDDNSRRKVQNVGGDSSGVCLAGDPGGAVAPGAEEAWRV